MLTRDDPDLKVDWVADWWSSRPEVGRGQWLGYAGLVRAEASKEASAYQVRFFCLSPWRLCPSQAVHHQNI